MRILEEFAKKSDRHDVLIEKINAFLKVHQEKREKAKDQINEFLYENQ